MLKRNLKKNVGRTAKPSNITCLLESDKFPFGKYKGRSVIEILVSDPQYILWANENVDYIKFNESTISRANTKAKQKENDFYRRKKQTDYDDEPLLSNILDL